MHDRDINVISSFSLSDKLKEEIVVLLKNKLNCVKVNFDVNPEIVGGIVVNMGDTQIDLSLDGKLKQLEVKLKNE